MPLLLSDVIRDLAVGYSTMTIGHCIMSGHEGSFILIFLQIRFHVAG